MSPSHTTDPREEARQYQTICENPAALLRLRAIMMVPVRVLVKQCLPDEAESRPSRASDGLPGRQCQAPQGTSPAGRPGATARESPPNQAAARAAAALRLGSTISAALAHHPLPSFSLSPSTPLPFSLFPFLVLPSPHPLQSLRLQVPLRAVPAFGSTAA